MSMFKAAALVGALASTASAHGTLQGIVADGTYYEGYSPSMQYQTPAPVVIGWASPDDLDNGYVAPDAYANSDIICHKGATNAQTSATIKAGDDITLEWTAWPESHHGPVITYLANCNGDCSTVDKTTLQFVKIDAGGLIDDTTVPGTWASDNMISNNNSWVTTIPSSIAAGNYVLRNEIIALHGAESSDGAQNYPQCINLEITGDGTDSLAEGTLGTALYTETDPGILVNIYASLSTYVIPGPTLYSGASSGSATATSTTVAATSTSAATSVATSTSATSIATSTSATTSAVASSSAIAAAEVTTDVTTATTTTVTSPATVVSTTAAQVSQVVGVTSLVPSSVLTAAVSAIPSATGVTKPSSQLPDGFTIKDVLQWFTYVMENMLNSERKHARDLKAVEKRQDASMPSASGLSGAQQTPSFGQGSGAQQTPGFGAGSGARQTPSFGQGSGAQQTPSFGQGSGAQPTPGFGQGSGAQPTPGFGQGSGAQQTPGFGVGFDAQQTPSFGQGSGAQQTPSFGQGSGAQPTPGFGQGSGAQPTPGFGQGSGAQQTPSFGEGAGAQQTPSFGSGSGSGAQGASGAQQTPSFGSGSGASGAQPTPSFGSGSGAIPSGAAGASGAQATPGASF